MLTCANNSRPATSRRNNKRSDADEPTFDGQTVTLIPEVKEAWTFASADLIGMGSTRTAMLTAATVAQAAFAWIAAANVSTSGYLMLTIANANLLAHFTPGTDRGIRQTHAGGPVLGHHGAVGDAGRSSLADITTRAEPQSDGTCSPFGSKMWISGVELMSHREHRQPVLAKISG